MNMLWLRIVDANFRTIRDATVRAVTADMRALELQAEGDRWTGRSTSGDRVRIHASAQGFEPEGHTVVIRDAVTQVVIGLRRPGQLSYTYGNDRLAFVPVADAFLVGVRGAGAGDLFSTIAAQQGLKWRPVLQQATSCADDIFVRVEGDLESARGLSTELSRKKLAIETALVIQHGDRPPVGLTNELVVRFQDYVNRLEAERLATSAGLRITRTLRHAGNAFVLARGGEPSYDLLRAADALSESGHAVYVEPNLTFAVELDQYTPNDPLWGSVPHLRLIRVDYAWDLLGNVGVGLRGGSPDITIAITDLKGVAPNHPDLTANVTDGTSKLVSCMNFAAMPISEQTVATLGDDHGTACAGSAAAAFDNNRGLPGVAPNCHLIGARIKYALDDVRTADVFLWVAGFLNGSEDDGFPSVPPIRAADVLSSSWGSKGQGMSNIKRDCFDFLTTYGRNGKGCVLCFSLGNDGYFDFTDSGDSKFRAMPAHEKTLGVGSSMNVNPTSHVSSDHPDPYGDSNGISTAVDTRSLFSPYGATALRKPDLVSPSSTAYDSHLTIDPILAAVRVGMGNDNGCTPPYFCKDYDSSFGGTSHSTPTVAGAAALILSARPNLNWVQVREILRQSCVRIDAAQANETGRWQDLDGEGQINYSQWYGAGRLDVKSAVELALDDTLLLADTYVRKNLDDRGDLPASGPWWASPDIWVRQDASTPIPELAWTDPAPHENGRRGQDNSVFCRVRNRGSAPAPVVYVRAMITHWPGLEFVYPEDFQPSINADDAVPNPLVTATYVIGEVRIDNLAAGASQIVRMIWPQALIPPETVVVSGATVRWHPCLLVEASPHDGPDPIGGLSVPVQGNNNIAQRNILIVNVLDADPDSFAAVIAGTRDAVGVATLIIDATLMRGAASIRLHVTDERAMRKLIGSVSEPSIVTGGRASGRITTGMVVHQNLVALEIKGLSGQLELPMRLPGGQFVPLLVAVTGPGIGDLQITQRRGDGELSAGYGIRRCSQ